jgi:hypothetical protein
MTIEKGKAVEVQEKFRTYTYPGGHKVILQNVTELIVSESGTHRLKADGGLYIQPVGWISIHIDAEGWVV